MRDRERDDFRGYTADEGRRSDGSMPGYFVQTTKDAASPEPNNAQLMYEIRGVTSDHQDTIVARFAARHPQLPDGSKVLDAQGNIRALTSFPSYMLLEKSRPESFEPSLTETPEYSFFDCHS